MYRRWAYMAIAIVATVLLTVSPFYRFRGDEGIIYDRHYTMTKTEIYRISDVQEHLKNTDIPDGAKIIVGDVSGLYYCYKIIFWNCIACFLLFYPTKVRWYMSILIALEAVIFYILYIHYLINVSDADVTLGPTWVVMLPGIVIAMMVLLNRNVSKYGNYFDDIREE